MMQSLLRNLRFGVRLLTKSPGFTVAAKDKTKDSGGTGIGIGLLEALFLTQLMSSMLYQTGSHDPVTFLVAPFIFLSIALVANYLPARRATKTDPIEALRVP